LRARKAGIYDRPKEEQTLRFHWESSRSGGLRRPAFSWGVARFRKVLKQIIGIIGEKAVNHLFQKR
jgi:hypothetical protein